MVVRAWWVGSAGGEPGGWGLVNKAWGTVSGRQRLFDGVWWTGLVDKVWWMGSSGWGLVDGYLVG